MSDTQVITISRNGEARFLYDDRLRGLLTHGPASVARAGHVEPGDPRRKQDPASWYADLKPVGGPVFGPFRRRSGALEAEVLWLQSTILNLPPSELDNAAYRCLDGNAPGHRK